MRLFGRTRVVFPSAEKSVMMPPQLLQASHWPSGLGATKMHAIRLLRDGQDSGHRPAPQRLERQAPSLGRVVHLEALPHVGQGQGGVGLQLQPPERHQTAGLAAPLGRHGLLARDAHDDRHRAHTDEGRSERRAAQPAAPQGAIGHGSREGLLDGGELPGIALAPERELAEGRARPQEVRRAALLVPQVRGLLELVAQQRALRVLRLPAHEAQPRPEQRLVDDLDAVRPGAGRCHAFARALRESASPRSTSAAARRPAAPAPPRPPCGPGRPTAAPPGRTPPASPARSRGCGRPPAPSPAARPRSARVSPPRGARERRRRRRSPRRPPG